MIDLLEFDFMRRALAASLLAGAGLSVVGVLVVLLEIPFLGISMSHAAFLGAIAGQLCGVSPVIGAAVACLAAASIVGPIGTRSRMSSNVALSILFSGTMGMALLLLHFLPGPRSSALSLIWGSILTVTRRDVVVLGVLNAGLLALLVVFYRQIVAVLYDRTIAATCGVPAALVYGAILVSAGLMVSASLPMVGGLLIFGLLVNPASAARQLTNRLEIMLALAAAFGVLSCLGGLAASAAWDVPAGAAIILVSSLIFALALWLSPRRRLARRGTRRERLP